VIGQRINHKKNHIFPYEPVWSSTFPQHAVHILLPRPVRARGLAAVPSGERAACRARGGGVSGVDRRGHARGAGADSRARAWRGVRGGEGRGGRPRDRSAQRPDRVPQERPHGGRAGRRRRQSAVPSRAAAAGAARHRHVQEAPRGARAEDGRGADQGAERKACLSD